MTHSEVEAMEATESEIAGLWVLRMKQASDPRGTVREFFRDSAFREAGVPTRGPWLQVNVTETRQGAIRGLHGEATDKLVGVVEGEAFGAYVDVRADSVTRGRTFTTPLTKGVQVLVPAGVCNGFQATAPGVTQYVYCFTREWAPGMSGVAVNPLDPALGIDWPLPVDVDDPAQLSAKDRSAPALSDVL